MKIDANIAGSSGIRSWCLRRIKWTIVVICTQNV